MAKSKNMKFNNVTHTLKTLGLTALLVGTGLKSDTHGTADSSSDELKTTMVALKERIDANNTAELVTSLFEKKYVITDRKKFDSLWNDAKPFCIPVLIASENWRTDWHNDKQQTNSTPNSVGVGLFSFPKDRNFSSTAEWISTRKYYTNYKNKNNTAPKNLTPQEIRDGIYGWCINQKDGANAAALYNALRGTELTINEFAAIYSHYYHTGNLKAAKKIVAIKNDSTINDKNLKCAQVLLDTDPITYSGRKSRFMHEALIFLNTDKYCNDLFYLCVDCHLGTSINACPGEFANVCNGKLTNQKAKVIKENICNYTLKDGIQIKELCESIKDNSIMAFCIETAKTKELDERTTIYRQAMIAYNKHDYETAEQLFTQVVQKHGEGPDLWNNLAITYFNLKEYDECIKMCQLVLKSDATDEYAKACYNAGKAYEAKQDYPKALEFYNQTLEYYKKYGIADKDPNVNYEKIYNNSIARVKPQVPDNQKTKKNEKSSKKTKKGKYKSAILLVTAIKNQKNIKNKKIIKNTDKNRG